MKMEDLKSSIPGFTKFSARSNRIATGDGYIEGRRKVDGAEGLWRINNGLYDLNVFAKTHPGGFEWISITRGTDITELFETHHITDKAEKLLPKLHIRDAAMPRAVPLTFKKDGFYRKFKERAYQALKNIDFHKPSLKSNLITDFLAVMTILLCLVTAKTESPVAAVISGICLTLTTISAHNYFHMRDNFRLYYWDMSLMSSREWRITHAMSHHMYPNTIWDFEIYAFEPFFQYLPKLRSPIVRAISWIYAPLLWFLVFYSQGIKRYLKIILIRKNLEIRDIVPFFIPALMLTTSGNLNCTFFQWMLIIGVSSFLFHFIALHAAHHHPDIFHDGDIPRNDLDWGLLEMDAVRDREIVDDCYFLILTQFGLHTLHHLLPTVDHAYLLLCLPALEDTCREFNINLRHFTPVEMIKGQFKQLRRVEIKMNYR